MFGGVRRRLTAPGILLVLLALAVQVSAQEAAGADEMTASSDTVSTLFLLIGIGAILVIALAWTRRERAATRDGESF